MLSIDKCRVNASIIQELEELFFAFGPEDIARCCDNEMKLLMCLQNGECDGNDYSFLSQLRDTFNRIARLLDREPYKPGIDD